MAIEELRESAPARSLALVRRTAVALRSLGWRVAEGAYFEGGALDVSAERVWSRPTLHARVRLVVNCLSSAEQVLFSQAPEINVADILPSHSISDAAATRGAVVPAPRARTHAATFREIGGDDFHDCVAQTFMSIDAIQSTLRHHDLAVIEDDEEASPVHTLDLLHPIIVTDATLWTLSDRLTRKPSVRLFQSALIGGEHRWIDVVHAESIDTFAAAITKHYEQRYKRFSRAVSSRVA